jgi:nucleoside-diphosphate-sugar epimerase
MASLSDSAPERRRVLLTGARGFTGQYLADRLRREGWTPLPIEPTADAQLDLRDASAVRSRVAALRPSHAIHLAAISFVGHGDPSEFYAVNTVGTEHLLAALAAEAPALERCIIASSANVYGNADVDMVEETLPPAPVNHYACSKLAMEHIARTWLDRLPVVVVRPFNYTGVGQSVSFLVPKLVDAFAKREPVLRLGNLNVVRDFSDVRTVCEAYVRLLDAGLPGDLLNVCSGTGHSLLSVVNSLRTLSGHDPSVEQDPSLMRRAELVRLIGCNQRLVQRVGPLASPAFEDTLRWMLNSAERLLASYKGDRDTQ